MTWCVLKKAQESSLLRRSGGFSLVEVIITIAIFVLVFGGLFGGVQMAMTLIGTSKAEAGAQALMVEQMEYIRALSYTDVGTVSGVPSGNIPQNSTVVLNGVDYNQRVLIQYIDDDADGTGAADTNLILADYIQVKIEYTWELRGRSDSASIVSNIVPIGIETTDGGGTIRVNVFDAAVLPLSGAEVRFYNDTGTSTIDTIRYTDPSGIAYLSGAPEAANYQITVTDVGYSTDGTYMASSTNPNPATSPIAVLESQVSTMNFQIDELSDLVIETVNPATYGSYDDLFDDATGLISQASTSVSAGSLLLSDTLGVYVTAGSATTSSTTPATIESWYAVEFTGTTTASTSALVTVLYDNGGVLEAVPNTDLPGNTLGFDSSPVDITGLDPLVYDTLALRFDLSTVDTTATPEIYDVTTSYVTSQTPIAGIQLTIEGAKSIGTDAGSQPVLKYTDTGTTDASGEWEQLGIEYDIYTVTVDSAGYDIYEQCAASPISIDPNVTETMSIVLGASAGNMVRVNVTETDGTPIAGALVRLQNTGIDELSTSSLCGQTYFGTGLYADDDYLLTVSAGGFTTETVASTTVSSSSTVNVILN